MEHNQNFLSNELMVDPAAYSHLKETAGWAKFIGIVGFVFSALILLVAIFFGAFFSRIMGSQPGGMGGPFAAMGGGIFISIIYIFVAAVSFALSYIVFRFGVKTQEGLRTSDQASLNAGLNNLKILFRIYGIILIIYLGMLALTLVISAVAYFMKG